MMISLHENHTNNRELAETNIEWTDGIGND